MLCRDAGSQNRECLVHSSYSSIFPCEAGRFAMFCNLCRLDDLSTSMQASDVVHVLLSVITVSWMLRTVARLLSREPKDASSAAKSNNLCTFTTSCQTFWSPVETSPEFLSINFLPFVISLVILFMSQTRKLLLSLLEFPPILIHTILPHFQFLLPPFPLPVILVPHGRNRVPSIICKMFLN